MSGGRLESDSVSSGYGRLTIIRGVSLDVRANSVTALLGSNGAGKTTFMLTLAGLMPITAGEIRYEGRPIGRMTGDERVELGIALVPEGRMVFGSLTVEENLRLGAISRRAKPQEKRNRERMYARFPRLLERRRQRAMTLSGGEQQMLAIARSLMSCPSVLLMDEPTLGLAPAICKEIFALVAELRNDGLTILIAEQDVPKTLEIADFGYVFEQGHVALEGPARELAINPDIRRAFMGL